jgi:hypothetical protein
MATLPLPTERPKWYDVKEDRHGVIKGWTPETSDITSHPENREITDAWSGTYYPPSPRNYTIKINRLKVLSPIQVGGDSFFEGGTLPAQINGVPCVPGSSIRGAFLSWLRDNLAHFPQGEQTFWSSLIAKDGQSWQPRKIRFETILLKQLKPYPLNAQQLWQVFDERTRNLGVQWQVSPKHPPNPNADTFDLNIIIKPTPTEDEKKWVQQRINEFLEQRGIGRGTASGFGRLGRKIPDGKWEIELTGMKPCVQPHDLKKNQTGQYRWSPQVLRANLRSYFTRLALAWLNLDQAKQLTDKIFGGFKSPARLVLTSYLRPIPRTINNEANQQGYSNIPAREAHQVWCLPVNCNDELKDLVANLLELSSRLGGLGPGWRRPPHQMNRGVFRGSQFSYSPNQSDLPISDLIQRLYEQVKSLAQEYDYNLFNAPQRCAGGFNSIWQGEPDQWEDIVHGVCRTNDNPNRPDWCGNSQNRPSGYAVRQHEQYCLVTVFDPAVEPTLRSRDFQCIWQITA